MSAHRSTYTVFNGVMLIDDEVKKFLLKRLHDDKSFSIDKITIWPKLEDPKEETENQGYLYKAPIPFNSVKVEFLTALDDLWKCVRRNLTDTEPHITSCSSLYLNGPRKILKTDSKSEDIFFWKFFLDMTDVLVECRSRNIALLADLLEFACRMSTMHASPTLFSDLNDELYFLMLRVLMSSAEKFGRTVWEYIPIKEVGKTKSIIQELLSLPYNIAHNYVKETDFDIKKFMISGNYKLVKILLRFGVTILRPVDSKLEMEYTHFVFCSLFKLPRQANYKKNMKENFNSDSRQRLYLLRGTLEVLSNIRSNPKHTDKYVRCMELFFNYIPDPIVSVDEIENSLQKFFCGVVPDKDILSVCQEFGRHFPESLKPPEPRSLKHLSRIQVRDNLRTYKCCLPGEVNSMPIPQAIKDYILLEEDNKFEVTPEMLTFDPSDIVRNNIDIELFTALGVII